MSLHSVYICEDFEVGNGILTIWDAKEVAKVKDIDGFNRISEILKIHFFIINFYKL